MKRLFYLNDKEIIIPSPTVCEMTKTHIISTGTEHTTITFNLPDAVAEFTRIRKPADIKRYASKYGMLGVHFRPDQLREKPEYLLAAVSPTPEHTTESIHMWFYLSGYLRDVISMSEFIRNPKDSLRFGTFVNGEFYPNEGSLLGKFDAEDIQTIYHLAQSGELDETKRDELLQKFYNQRIAFILEPPTVFVDFDVDQGSTNKLLNGRKCTYHLYAALFYGAWDIIVGNGVEVDYCDECKGLMIVRRKRIGTAQYCSPKCKMKAQRRNE